MATVSIKIGSLVEMKDIPRENEEHDVGIVVSFRPSTDGFYPGAIVSWSASGMHWHKMSNLELI